MLKHWVLQGQFRQWKINIIACQGVHIKSEFVIAQIISFLPWLKKSAIWTLTREHWTHSKKPSLEVNAHHDNSVKLRECKGKIVSQTIMSLVSWN